MGQCNSCGGGTSGTMGEISSDGERYFAYQYGDKFASTVFSYDMTSKKAGKIVAADTIDMQEHFTVQVLQDLYSYAHDTSQTSLIRYATLGSKPMKTEMRKPPVARGFPALAVYNSAFIFISGGQSPIEFTEEFASCDFYDVGKDQWK